MHDSSQTPQTSQEMVNQGLRRLGIFNALYSTGVLYNHVVFRVVAGVTGAIQAEAVAMVTMLEYTSNCLLEVPMGIVADKIGRVRSTIIGLVFIALGLCAIYAALLTHNKELSFWLIILDGLLLGVGKPMMSGSVEAFYQDAILRHAGSDPNLKAIATGSFTSSVKFGRNYPFIGTITALVTIFVFSQTIGDVHAFIIGIGIYILVIMRVTADLKILGEEHTPPSFEDNKKMLQTLKSNAQAKYAMLLKIFLQVINSIISGYMIVTLLRYSTSLSKQSFWMMFIVITVSTGLSLTVRGYILNPVHRRFGRKALIYFALLTHMIGAFLLAAMIEHASFDLTLAMIFVYNILFYISQQALNVSTLDIMNSVLESKYRATAISIMNMPAFLFVGLYSLYLSVFRHGAPGYLEMFYSCGALAFICILVSIWFFRKIEIS